MGECRKWGWRTQDPNPGEVGGEPRGLTTVDAKLDPAVHIVGPDVLWRFTVEHREDSSAQVGLAGSRQSG